MLQDATRPHAPSGPNPDIAPDPRPTLALRQRQRRLLRQRRSLVIAGALFSIYYLCFRALGVYTNAALAVGLAMGLGLVACGLLLPRVTAGGERLLALTAALVVAVGALLSAALSDGPHCMGFHTIWALPLVYGLLFQHRAGLVTVALLALSGGAALLARDGESAVRIFHWSTLALAAGVFSLAQVVMLRRESRTNQHDTEESFAALVSAESRRAEENAGLLRELGERTAELADANTRLTENLAALERAQSQLVQAGRSEAIGRIAGGVAHDFNNLLSVILASTSMVRDALPAGSEAARDLDDVLRASEQGAAITRQLLALSRQQVQRPEVIDLGVVAEGMLGMLRRVLDERIEARLERLGPSLVRADRVQLEQVLLNLVLNARDALPGGGHIVVRVGPAPDSEGVRTAGLAAPHGTVALEVEDDGEGMDGATLERIFEPFFSTKEVGKGTGLGLAVARGIVEQGGGRILCESTRGQGTRFLVLLPAVQPVVPRDEPLSAAGSPVPAPRATILLAEDEDVIRRIAARVLRQSGFEVLEARDGLHALDVARQAGGHLDLLLTDVGMPNMGGADLARRLRLARPQLRVAFMSGHGSDLIKDSSDDAGLAYLQKPFTPAALRCFVTEQLSRDPTAAPHDEARKQVT